MVKWVSVSNVRPLELMLTLVFCGVHDSAEAELTLANAIAAATTAESSAIFRISAPYATGRSVA
jgi:hypothetical protein